MAEIFRSTLHARGVRLPVLVLVLFLAISAGGMSWAVGEANLLFLTVLGGIHAAFTGAGLIGSDVSDGTLQLLLTRPITRNQYLAGRGLGALVLAWGGGLLILAGTAVGLRLHGPLEKPSDLGWLALSLLAQLAWQVAVCFALSTVLAARGDIVIYVLLLLSSAILAAQAGAFGWPWLSASIYWARAQIDNGITLLGGPSPVIWHDLARWSSNVAVVVFLGCLAFHRKEFSYGAG